MATDFGFRPETGGDHYFISYNTEDTFRVGDVARTLHRAGIPLWYDYGLEYGKAKDDTLPSGYRVTHIGKGAFNGCARLKEITIPKGVDQISDLTFRLCENMLSVAIPENVTAIGEKAFSRCRALSAITIPDSVTGIGSKAFSGCVITVTAPHDPEYYGYTPDYGVTWATRESGISIK